MKALSGIRVLDFSQGAAGPYASMVLGDFGAEIIKVEPPSGDWGRTLGPPFIQGESAVFLSMNRNKQSIVLDLKNSDGLSAAKKMAEQVDIIIESFRPDVLDKLGLGYAEISKINPKVIYCSISGFGQTGPWKNRPGVDGIMQAISGFMSVTGEGETAPVKGGTIVADFTTGALAINGILLAVLARERTGRGQKVEQSLFDAMLAIQSTGLASYFASGVLPQRFGSHAPYAVPNGAFPTKDSYIMVAANLGPKWKSLCDLIGKSEWMSDPRFATNQKRVENRHILVPLLEEIFREKTSSEWLPLLEKAEIICAPIATYEDLEHFEQIKVNKMFVELDHPTVGTFKHVGIPQKLSGTPGEIHSVPPLLGQHTKEVLQKFDFTKDEIDLLVEMQAAISTV